MDGEGRKGIIKGARRVLRVVAICARYLDCGGAYIKLLADTDDLNLV